MIKLVELSEGTNHYYSTMQRTTLSTLLVYGLVGLAIAGSVITVSEIASKVVPLIPRNGQLLVDFSTSSQPVESPTGSPNSSTENFTLDVTTNLIMVHRTGEFNVTSGWSAVLDTTRTVTLQTGKRVDLGSITLPEGNITMVRISVLSATVQRSSGGVGEPVRVPSGKLEIPTSAQIRAQAVTHIIVDIHLVCPGSNGNPASPPECLITPVLHVEE